MSTCVDIEKAISEFEVRSTQTQIDINKIIDTFLDQLLITKELLEKQSGNMDDITYSLIQSSYTISRTSLDANERKLNDIYTMLLKTYQRIRKNPKIYSGVKLSLTIYKSSLSAYKETIDDLYIVTNKINSKNYNDSVSFLNSL